MLVVASSSRRVRPPLWSAQSALQRYWNRRLIASLTG